MVVWLKEMGYKPIREKTFCWLVNPKTHHNLFLDIYVPELRLAIEYDGPQHFRIVKSLGMNAGDLKDQQKRDVIKDILCERNNVKMIRFASGEKFNRSIFLKKLSSCIPTIIQHWK